MEKEQKDGGKEMKQNITSPDKKDRTKNQPWQTVEVLDDAGNDNDAAKNQHLPSDEVVADESRGYEHVELEDDDSEQHPDERKGNAVKQETRLDEVAKDEKIQYPDIE